METYIQNVDIVINKLASYNPTDIQLLIEYFKIENSSNNYCASIFELANKILEHYNQDEMNMEIVNAMNEKFTITDPECLGQFKIDEKLGAGSFGTVFTGELFGKKYAIKIVQIDQKEYEHGAEEFKTETEINELFNQYDFGPIIYDYYICRKPVSVYIPGDDIRPMMYLGIIVYDIMDGNLKSYFIKKGYLLSYDNVYNPYKFKDDIEPTPEEKVNILRLVYQTKKMHELGYGHYDMKLENCLYYDNPLFFTLSDFGVSKKIEENWDYFLDDQPYWIYVKSIFHFYLLFNQDLVNEITKLIGFPKEFYSSPLGMQHLYTMAEMSEMSRDNVQRWFDSRPAMPKYNMKVHPEYYDYIFCFLMLRQFNITKTTFDAMNFICKDSSEILNKIHQEIEKYNLDLPLPNYNKRLDYKIPYYPPRDPDEYKKMKTLQRQRNRIDYSLDKYPTFIPQDLNDISFSNELLDFNVEIHYDEYAPENYKADVYLYIKKSGNVFIDVNDLLNQLNLNKDFFNDIDIEDFDIYNKHDNINLYIKDFYDLFYGSRSPELNYGPPQKNIYNASPIKNKLNLDIKSFQINKNNEMNINYGMTTFGKIYYVNLPYEAYNINIDLSNYEFPDTLFIRSSYDENYKLLDTYNILHPTIKDSSSSSSSSSE